MMGRLFGRLVMVLFCLASAPLDAQDKRVATFQIGDQSMTWDLPERYCLPAGQDATTMQMLAAADPQNVTSLSVLSCEGEPKLNHYVLFKTPTQALPVSMERAVFISAMGAAFDKPEFADVLKSGKIAETAKDGFNKTFGTTIDMQPVINPMGRDGSCAYLGGVTVYSQGDKSERVAMVLCMTTLKKKIVAIDMFEKYVDAETIAKMLPQVRAIAEQLIAQNEAK